MKNFDNSFLSKKVKYIAGTDEAGRGPLAGPVVAAAVIFSPDVYIEGVNDSKQLTEELREELAPQIVEKCLSCSITAISHTQIDKINILQASLKAMLLCIRKLKTQPDLILIDGNKSFFYEAPTIPIIKGDSKSFAIAAASILAKVARDRVMKRLSLHYPDYLWEKNKGYATPEHIEAIKIYGSCRFHRKTFLKKILFEENCPEFAFEMETPEE